MLDWCRLGGRRFTQPFFDETISACLQRPFNLLFRRLTPIDALLEWQERSPAVPPSGFIFHMSRCGSTLAARMLAASPRNIVLSEADPIDSVLRATCATPPSPRPTAGFGSGPSSVLSASGGAATRRTCTSNLRAGTSLKYR